jgi:glycosyltransferase involved in cell wall biosynthesis
MTENMQLISIIVPVYNVEDYLRQCLDSLVKQTYSNIEIICVNDGSTDKSLEIIREYAKKDDRILVINQPNAGVANARNNAIDKSSGKYMMFVDPDDWVELNICETAVNCIEKYNADVVMYSYYREYENRSLAKKIFDIDIIVFEKDECKELHRRHSGIVGKELRKPQNADALCSLCTKIFKADIIKINQIRFIDNKKIGTYEDGIFNLYYFNHIDRAIYIDENLYHYRKTNQNSITTVYNETLPELWNNQFDIIQKYIDDNSLDDTYNEGLNNRIALSIIVLGLNIAKSKCNIFDKIKKISKLIKYPRTHKAIKILEIREMPLYWKVFFVCCKLNLYFLIYLQIFAISKLKEKI